MNASERPGQQTIQSHLEENSWLGQQENTDDGAKAGVRRYEWRPILRLNVWRARNDEQQNNRDFDQDNDRVSARRFSDPQHENSRNSRDDKYRRHIKDSPSCHQMILSKVQGCLGKCGRKMNPVIAEQLSYVTGPTNGDRASAEEILKD